MGVNPSNTESGIRDCCHRVSVAQVTSVHDWFDVRIFHHECQTLAAAGYDVTLFAPRLSGNTDPKIRLRDISVAKSKMARILTSSVRLYRTIRAGGFDVVHVHDPELLPLAMLLTLRGQRVIIDVHESLYASISTKDYLGFFARSAAKLVDIVQRYVSRKVTAVVVATPDLADTVESASVFVVGNYPDMAEFEGCGDLTIEDYCERQPSATYVGDLTRIRCIPEILEAAPLVAVDDFVLRVAGRPTEIEPRDTEFVEYLGVIDRPAVVALLNSVRIGLCLFAADPNHTEARPNKLFEYLSAGLPVIVARTTRWAAEFVENNNCGVVVETPDAYLIASAINEVLSDPTRAYEMGQRGRDLVRRDYTWASQAEVLLAAYDHVLNKDT